MSPANTGRAANRGLALAVLLTMQLMVILDGTIVTVALPTIQTELGFTTSALAWVVNAYLIAFAGLLLLSGRLGDLIGTRGVFLAGLAVFTTASVAAALAADPALLIAGRFGQGIGGAMASAVILSMIVKLYPEPREQAKAMGLYGSVGAGGAAIGLVAGGVITQTLGWQGVFWVNVPIGVLTFAAALAVLPRTSGLGLDRGADAIGAALVTAGLSLAVYAIAGVAEPDVTPGRSTLLGGVAVALIAAFLVRQSKATVPLLPLRLLRDRRTSAANAVVVLTFAAGFGFQFTSALYLQHVLGFDAMRTGLSFLPAPVTITVVSLVVAARLVARFGTRTVIAVGLLALISGMLGLGRAPVDGGYLLDVMPMLILMGGGFGLIMPAAIMTAMSGAAPEDQGAASGLNNTAQQAGGAIGLAVLATAAASTTASRLESGTETVRALRDGFSTAYLGAAVFALAALAVTLLAMRRDPDRVDEPDRATAEAPTA